MKIRYILWNPIFSPIDHLNGLDLKTEPREAKIAPGWHVALGTIAVKYGSDNKPKRTREYFGVDSDTSYDRYVLYDRILLPEDSGPEGSGLTSCMVAKILVVSQQAFALVPGGDARERRKLCESVAVQPEWNGIEDYEDYLGIEHARDTALCPLL